MNDDEFAGRRVSKARRPSTKRRNSSTLSFAGLLLVALSWTARAPATEPTSAVCETPDPTARRHDGFFLRAESGLAGFDAAVSGSASGRDRLWGIGQSGAIFVGGTPRRGLVVGGYVWTARIDPTFRVRGVRVSPDDDSVKLTLGRLGPFLDWYPDPLLGFHTQVSAGVAVQVESDVKGNSIKPAGVGAAGAFGIGYEWFVGSQFSIGAMARVSFGALTRSPGSGEERTFFEVPELSLTSTYQ
ncbi:MAG TPA: hypothetical protein VH062_03225 [Polyangiaceae bacterium]|jgi:hypothetical protein|nr:hypothetical protein [Polyangiaceae bacterium]